MKNPISFNNKEQRAIYPDQSDDDMNTSQEITNFKVQSPRISILSNSNSNTLQHESGKKSKKPILVNPHMQINKMNYNRFQERPSSNMECEISSPNRNHVCQSSRSIQTAKFDSVRKNEIPNIVNKLDKQNQQKCVTPRTASIGNLFFKSLVQSFQNTKGP